MQSQQQLSSETPPASSAFIQRLPILIIAGGLILIVGWLGIRAWRIYTLAQALRTHQATAERMLAGGPSAVDPQAAVTLTHDVRRDVVALQQEVDPFLSLAPYLGWLPKVGPLMPIAPELLEMADAGTEAAVLLADEFEPALALLQADQPQGERIPQLIALLVEARPALRQTEMSLARVATARAAIGETDHLPGRVQAAFEQVDGLLPLAQKGLKLAPHLPALVGMDGRRHYLVLAQNEEELRATGGYISGVGLLALENGRIVSLEFSDGYAVDRGNWFKKPYDFPPQPLYDFMGAELFLFRDSNFWPDFPTSAEQAMQLYTYARETPLDGVVAIDQEFLIRLVTLLEPVAVPELNLTLTGDNLVPTMHATWSQGTEGEEWFATRKAFMEPIAGAIRHRLEADLGSVDLLGLAHMLEGALAEKHLQIYVRAPEVAALLADFKWDGRIQNSPHSDVLLVLDSNLGFNKVNALVQRQVDYRVALEEDGSAAATLNLTYQHMGTTTADTCSQELPAYERGLSYDVMIDRCYWNYLRIYTPTGSQLLEASRHPAPADYFTVQRPWTGTAQTSRDKTGLTIFSNFFVLERSHTLTTTYTYTLPGHIVENVGAEKQYRLRVYKQAGLSPHPVEIRVQLPAGAHFVASEPAATAVEAQTVLFTTSLNRDLSFEIRFR